MKRKSNAYARGILSITVNHFQAWTVLFTIWLGQMKYPLSATSLWEAQCKNIESRAVNVPLTKCGFNRKMSRAIVFGSLWFGGMRWRQLLFEQGIQHVLTLIKHLRTPGPFHSLLTISLHWYQVIMAGVYFSLFRYPSFRLPYLDHPWFDSTKSFIRLCSAHLEIPNTPLPLPKQFNDTCIMDGFLEQDLSPTALQRINCCRLFLQVTQLSEISTLAGDQIKRNA